KAGSEISAVSAGQLDRHNAKTSNEGQVVIEEQPVFLPALPDSYLTVSWFLGVQCTIPAPVEEVAEYLADVMHTLPSWICDRGVFRLYPQSEADLTRTHVAWSGEISWNDDRASIPSHVGAAFISESTPQGTGSTWQFICNIPTIDSEDEALALGLLPSGALDFRPVINEIVSPLIVHWPAIDVVSA